MSERDTDLAGARVVVDRHRGGAGWRAQAALTPAAAFFHGHFPGHPVLPAVAQLALVEQVVCRVVGRDVVFVGIERARFLRPVGPNEELFLHLTAGAHVGRITFVLLRGEERISDGIVICAPRRGESDAP